MARAEAAVLSLRGFYKTQLGEDVLALGEIWERLDRGASPSEVVADIHAIAHNVKGQGGSFGYHLVTDIGASLCDFIRSGDRHSPTELSILHAHIKALKTVSENDICGDGGDTGKRIVAELRTLTV